MDPESISVSDNDNTFLNANPDFKFLDSLEIDQDVKSRLSQLMYSTLKGNDQILISPIGRDGRSDVILEELDRVFSSNRDKLLKPLIDLELSNKNKFGPRSIAVPWSDRINSLKASFESFKHDHGLNNDFSNYGRLRPISLDNALSLLKNNTNSGLPYFTRKSKVKSKVLEEFDDIQSKEYPCVLFTRTQEQKKTRNVWGYPIADTLNEMRYYSPLLSYQKTKPYRSALISPDEVSRHLTRILQSAVRQGKSIISIDFTAYDTTVKSQLQMIAFDYIAKLYQPAYANDISNLFKRFNTIGIITPSGIFSGSHGVPSGSTFTNEVDSIVQAAISSSLDFIDLNDCQIQGDDGVYIVPKGKENVLYDTFESFGLNVNRDKSYISKDYAIYLQNLFHVGYLKDGIIGGIYPVYRALNRIIYQERWSNFEDYDLEGRDYYSIRTISILENCKYHPLFEELVKIVVKYDKYSLGFTNQSVSKYVKMLDETQGAGGIINNQYEDNVKGINNFETVKIIRSLS